MFPQFLFLLQGLRVLDVAYGYLVTGLNFYN